MTFTDWIAWAGLVVAFVAALFTGLQWLSAYRSAEAAERSAKASEDSAGAARTLVKTGQRAWITVTKVEPIERDNAGMPHGTRVHMRNAGLTPAFNLKLRQGFDIRSDLEDFRMLPSYTMNLAPLGAGQSDAYSHTLLINGPDWADIQAQRVKYFDIGQLEYEDVFKTPHIVTWCYYYVHQSGEFFPYERFNALD